MIDIACRRHGFDRLELRRRNLVPPAAMPYRNPLGLVYDSGDYPAALRHAAKLGDWAGFETRRAAARQRGRYRGIDVANSIELNTGATRAASARSMRLGAWVMAQAADQIVEKGRRISAALLEQRTISSSHSSVSS